MRKGLAVVVVGMLGCTPAAPTTVGDKPPLAPAHPQANVDPAPDPVAESKATAISVHMTSATLADDCGGGPNTRPRKREAKSNKGVKADRAKGRSAERRCEQSSIQLAIVAPSSAQPARLAVKSVELLLESGKSVGMLQTRAPSVWSDADGYTPWDENVEPATDLSVTYALTQPDWSAVQDRWNQTYTVKAVLSVAGTDQTVEQSVVVAAPTSLPPGVKT